MTEKIKTKPLSFQPLLLSKPTWNSISKLASICALMGFALVLGTTGCSQKTANQSSNVLRFLYRDDMKSLDPSQAFDEQTNKVISNVGEGLYQTKYLSDPFEIEPALALDLPTVKDSGKTYVFRLKPGVKFADDAAFEGGKGREVKAQDFVFAWKRHADPKLNSLGWWIFDQRFVGMNAFKKALSDAKNPEEAKKIFEGPVEGIQALDDYTIQIKLLKPYPQLMWVLTMHFMFPVAHENVTKYGDSKGIFDNHFIGTGPFLVKNWERNRRIEIVRNPNFRQEFYPTEGAQKYKDAGMLADAGKQLPLIDGVIFDVTRETQPRTLSFLNQTNDLLLLQRDDYPEFLDAQGKLLPKHTAKGVRMDSEAGNSFYFIIFNAQDPILKNKLVRKAMSLALDRDQWIKTFTANTAQKMVHVLPPGLADRPTDPKKISLKSDFNLSKAKEVLAQAGYPGGKGLPALTFDLRGSDTLYRQIGDFLVQQWAALGIKVNMVANTFPAFLKKQDERQLQIFLSIWGLDYPDAENILQLLYGPNLSPGPNAGLWQNPEYDRLYEQMVVLPAGPARAALIEKMDALIQEEAPWIYVYYNTRYWAAQPWVLNYRVTDLFHNHMKYVRISDELRKRYAESK